MASEDVGNRSLETVDDSNLASPCICIHVLYYQISCGFGMQCLNKVLQLFYHQQEDLGSTAVVVP